MTQNDKMSFRTLKDFDLVGQTVLLRADLNVPTENNRVRDTTRIDRLKPTIDFLRNAGAKILIISHFGRPKGEKNSDLSLAFLVKAMEKSWSVPITFAPDCIGEEAKKTSSKLQNEDIALLENLRFHSGEEANDKGFAQALSELADLYINDAFSVSHRAHASTEAITCFLPSAAGLLMQQELEALDQALGHPKHPVMAITGGSKISTKLSILKNLVKKVDVLVLGGAMANTFLFAQGAEIGSSMHEAEMAEEARSIVAHAEKNNCDILLPQDVVTTEKLEPHAPYNVTDAFKIPDAQMAIDIGPKTITMLSERLKTCRTIVWNGPMGVFEVPPFDNGTNELAKIAAQNTKNGNCVSIAGGGDTIAALENAGVADQFTYISTAGGAFLEWLEGKDLPGVTALYRNSDQQR